MNKLLLNVAWSKFPCQELWSQGNSFWSFEKGINKVSLTSGFVENENIYFNTLNIYVSDVESFIDSLCDSKYRDGYRCFASEMFN